MGKEIDIRSYILGFNYVTPTDVRNIIAEEVNLTPYVKKEDVDLKFELMTNGYIKKTSLPYSAEIDLDIIDSNANRKIKTVELILEYTPKDNINKYITNHFEEKSFVDFSLRFKIKSMKLSKE